MQDILNSSRTILDKFYYRLLLCTEQGGHVKIRVVYGLNESDKPQILMETYSLDTNHTVHNGVPFDLSVFLPEKPGGTRMNPIGQLEPWGFVKWSSFVEGRGGVLESFRSMCETSARHFEATMETAKRPEPVVPAPVEPPVEPPVDSVESPVDSETPKPVKKNAQEKAGG